MSDNFSLKELMELAKMKETRPIEYKKTLEGIKAVDIDIMKMGMEAVKEMEDD
jgi:hypothetical protein